MLVARLSSVEAQQQEEVRKPPQKVAQNGRGTQHCTVSMVQSAGLTNG